MENTFVPVHAYLVGTALFMIVWVIILARRRDLWAEILSASIGIGIIGFIVGPFYHADYWNPTYVYTMHAFGLRFGFEEFLYSFAIGGIASAVYEEWTGRRLRKRRKPAHTVSRATAIACVTVPTWSTLIWGLGMNSLYATVLITIGVGLFEVFERRDLWIDALVSGALTAGITIVILNIYGLLFPGIFQKVWLLDHISGIFLFGIPFEETLFALTLGFFVGPLYEFLRSNSVVRSRTA